MKKKSTGPTAKVKREIAVLKEMPDADVDFGDIPRQNPDDAKWKKAVVGKFYRPLKAPVSLRLDADVLDWLKSKGAGYQSRINVMLRERMNAERNTGQPRRERV